MNGWEASTEVGRGRGGPHRRGCKSAGFAFHLAHPFSLAYPPVGPSPHTQPTVKHGVNERPSLDSLLIVNETMSLAFLRSCANVFERRL